MAQYLLKADDVSMGRWREQASGEGMTFAAWIRSRLDCEREMTPAESQQAVLSEGGPVEVPRGAGVGSPVGVRARSRSQPCPRERFHRPGSYCKFCGRTP